MIYWRETLITGEKEELWSSVLKEMRGERTSAPVEGLAYRGAKAHSLAAPREKTVYVQGSHRPVGRCGNESMCKTL